MRHENCAGSNSLGSQERHLGEGDIWGRTWRLSGHLLIKEASSSILGEGLRRIRRRIGIGDLKLSRLKRAVVPNAETSLSWIFKEQSFITDRRGRRGDEGEERVLQMVRIGMSKAEEEGPWRLFLGNKKGTLAGGTWGCSKRKGGNSCRRMLASDHGESWG